MSSAALVAGLIGPVDGAFSVLKRTIEKCLFEFGANIIKEVFMLMVLKLGK